MKLIKGHTKFRAILYFIVSASLCYSCGPRSGINNNDADEHTNNNEAAEPICGNAIEEAKSYDWSNENLSIKGDGYNGEKLFKMNCAVCHVLTDQRIAGPGLKGLYWRIPEPKVEWLKGYILNSDSAIKAGDPYANKLNDDYKEEVMTNFKGVLNDQELNDLVVYIFGRTR